MDEIWCARLGLVPYDEARELQRSLARARHAGEVPDLLLLLEHPPVYTKGRRSEPAELGMGEDWYRMQGIEVTDTDRGGRVTYHGPGQLVGYPVVSLKDLGFGVADYIRRMEGLMTESLGARGIAAEVIDGLTGVWVEGRPPQGRKIGSIGVHVDRGITTHGFAINVNNDLQPFDWIVPCGIDDCRMTSVCRELGAEQDISAFMDAVVERFGRIYGRRPIEVSAAELRGRAAGRRAGALPSAPA